MIVLLIIWFAFWGGLFAILGVTGAALVFLCACTIVVPLVAIVIGAVILTIKDEIQRKRLINARRKAHGLEPPKRK